MKYIVILADGMADEPLEILNGKTPMEVAEKPHMDALARRGIMGTARTVPTGMPPGSDTANMAVMGFDPRTYYSGRSPLEAVAMGIDLKDDDVTYRANLVCLSREGKYEDKTMVDFSAGEISTEEAEQLIEAVQSLIPPEMKLYAGISYRHCLVRSRGVAGAELTPPHDITGKPIKNCLPKGCYGQELRLLQEASHELLKKHPVNLKRMSEGKCPANSLWFWGEGTKPRFDSMEKLYGVSGAVVCAVDLIKGLGLCAGLKAPAVLGATGGMVTDYRGKADMALKLLREGCDLVYIHIEAPDECSHHGNYEGKIAAIEAIDREILGYLQEKLEKEDYRILLLPDHPTPVSRMTHTAEPVPFVLFDSREKREKPRRYTEREAAATGLHLPFGHKLMSALVTGEIKE